MQYSEEYVLTIPANNVIILQQSTGHQMATSAMKEKTDFSHYGTKFQEGLVQIILDDRVFADQIMEVFDYDFLDLGYLRYITNMDVFARSTDSLDRVDVQVEYEKVTFFVDG